MLIDRLDATAVMSEPVGMFASPKTYFERSESGGAARVLDYHDGLCRGAFDFAATGRLLHRSRTALVLDGRFGSVFARFDYWHPPETPRIAVATGGGPRATPHGEGAASPADPKRAESFALVRVLKAKDRFKIASADYALDGGLRAMRVDLSSSDWTGAEVAFSSSAELAARYGLPARVDAATFATDPFKGFPPTDASVEAEAALVYRARGTVVERLTRAGAKPAVDWLAFPTTEVELPLAQTESKFPFAPGPGR